MERLVPDELWTLFRRVVPPTQVIHPQGGGMRRAGDRECLAAIISVAISGCTWRQLPPVYGPAWPTVIPALRPVEPGPGLGQVASRPVQIAAGTKFVEVQAVKFGPHPGLRPLSEPAEGRHTRQPEAWWQLVPGTPEVATKMMAASTSRSPGRRCPPP